MTLVHIATSLSHRFASVEDILGSVDDLSLPVGFSTTQEFCDYLRETQGLDNVMVGEPDRVIPQARDLVARFFDETGIAPADVTHLVTHDLWGNVTSDVHVAGYLQEEFGMGEACVFSLHQGCSTALLAMELGRRLLDQPGKYLMFITACYVPGPLANRFMAPHAMFGDGLALLVVGPGGPFEIVDFASACRGQASHETANGIDHVRDIIREVKTAVDTIRGVLRRNQVEVDDVALLIPQSINRQVFVNMYAKALRIPEEKVFSANIPHGGHIGDVDVLRNLQTHASSGALHDGDHVVLYAMGGPRGKDTSHDVVLLKYSEKESEQ